MNSFSYCRPWLATAAMVLVTACASTPRYMTKVEQQGDLGPLQIKDVLMASQNDLLKLNVILENSDDEPLNYRYRVRWTNVDGFQIWDDEPWKPMLIHAREKQVITVLAPSAKASDFRFVISKDK